MAFTRVAGVGFCIDPICGNPAMQTVDANYGLGESVVGGEMPVHHWMLDKATGLIDETAIATKTQRILACSSGTRSAELPDRLAEAPCLSTAE